MSDSNEGERVGRAHLFALFKLVRISLDPHLKWLFGKSAFLIVLIAAAQALGPLALREIINELTVKNFAYAMGAIGLYVGAAWAGRAMQAALVLNFGRTWRPLRRAMASHIRQHVLDLTYTFHLSQSSGKLNQTVLDGMSGMRSILSAFTFGITPTILQILIVSLIFIYSYEIKLLLALLVFSGCYGLLFHRGTRRQTNIQRKAAEADAHAAGLATDTLLGHETAKLLGIKRLLSDRVDAALARSESQWLEFFRVQNLNQQLLIGTFAISLTVILLISAHQVAFGSATIGDFVLVNAYVLQIMAPVERLSFASRDLIQGLCYVERMAALYNEKTESVINTGTHGLPGSTPLAIAVDDLWFGYRPDRPVLRGVSFRLRAGQTIAIVGASGSGKSTLWRLLCRLYDPERGRITVDGIPIDQVELTSLRRAISVIPQETTLYNESVFENVCFGHPDAKESEIKNMISLAGLEPVVAKLPDGWNTKVGERGLRFSGGERQRIAIARAMLKRPRLLILDEATSALDSKTEKSIMENLSAASSGLSTLIIAHRLSLVQHADEILVLDAGQIVERGPHHSLLSQEGAYAKMWQQQIGSKLADA